MFEFSRIEKVGEQVRVSKPVFRGEVRGRAIGAVVMSAFGFMWASLGVAGLSGSAFLTAVSAGTSVALIAAAVHLFRASATLPAMSPGTMDHAKVWRRFQIVGMTEGAVIFIVVFVLVRLGYPEWIPATVALIVGLHFFPLAPLFRVRLYYATGFLLCGIFALTVSVALTSDAGSLLTAIPGLGSAFVIWGTAGILVACGLKKCRSAAR